MAPSMTMRILLLAALLTTGSRLAWGQAPKTCGQAVAGYRFYGGGFNTGGADRLGYGQDYGATRDSADACRACCQSDSRCGKWVYHAASKACWRMTSGYTGTTSDAAFVSGSCSDTADPCAGYTDSSNVLSPDCIYKLWADAGCSPNNAASMPHAYWRDPWWAAATKAAIAQDMRAIAADPSDLKRGWCYPPKTCGQAVAGYRFYGGGFNAGGADRLGYGQDYGATRDSADACRAWCQSDSRCGKWVYHAASKACWRMTSGYTGTASDAAFVSGSCSDTTDPCAGYTDSSNVLSPNCIYKLWADAGCSPNNVASMPHAYWRDPWWAAATKAAIAQDMRAIAADPSDLKRGWCYPSSCAGRTCSGRGTCSGGVCSCQSGWTGTNCETQATQGLRTGGIVAKPAEYRPYLTNCSWLNRPYNAETTSTVSPVKCRDPANPADTEWYLFLYNSRQANWASVGLTWEVYNTAKVDSNCSGGDCFVRGCARESCCVALCADTVAQGGNCTWKDFDIGGGVMKRWYDIRPVDQPSTSCDPRGAGGGKGSGSNKGGKGRHLLGRQPTLATTDYSVGSLEPAPRAHRRSLQQDVAALPDRYLCDP